MGGPGREAWLVHGLRASDFLSGWGVDGMLRDPKMEAREDPDLILVGRGIRRLPRNPQGISGGLFCTRGLSLPKPNWYCWNTKHGGLLWHRVSVLPGR
jgi:hypothetical protein